MSKTDMDESILVVKAREFAQKVLIVADKAHDYEHTRRVYSTVVKLIQDENVDRESVLVGALLHDIADRKIFSSAQNLDEFFIQNPTEKEQFIRAIISEVSFSSGKKPTSRESEILQDADRLDAIGAIGIARAFAYGGKRDRALYGDGGTLDHFYEKLLLIKDLLNTEKAKKLAVSRHEFMEEFVKNFLEEIL